MTTRITGETEEEYRANPAVSWSKLKSFVLSPKLYWMLHVGKTVAPPKPTRSMFLGTAAHVLILEGQGAFEGLYEVDPAKDRRAKGFVAHETEAAERGMRVLTQEEYADLSEMANAIEENHDVAALLAVGEPEVPIRRAVAPDAPLIQGRIDWLGPKHGLDLKTILDVDKAEREIYSRQYYRQVAFYHWLMRQTVRDWYLPFIESGTPYRVRIYRLSAAYIQLGMQENLADFDRLCKCYESGDWSDGDAATVKEISPPAWALGYTEPAELTAENNAI
jgi:hypothetical protein